MQRFSRFSLLLLVVAALAPAALAQVPGVPEANDNFGEALAAGDFDGDGRLDLAVGVPGEDVGNLSNAGAVNVLYGTPFGFMDGTAQIWTQDSPGVGDIAQAGDAFGAALAVGDFDDDGYDDLAIGSPGEDRGGTLKVGQIHVLYGGEGRSGHGLRGAGSFYLNDYILPIIPGIDHGLALGAALATGDFNSDGYDDLAVGAPGFDFELSDAAGAVYLFLGSADGVTFNDLEVWHESLPDMPGYSWGDDEFGAALTVGDFNGDQRDDLAVGAPGDYHEQGEVYVFYSTDDGFSTAWVGRWDQDTPFILDEEDDGDRFGAALASGDFDADGYDDLAVGVPHETIEETYVNLRDGAVNVIYGKAGGLSAGGNQFWHLNNPNFSGVGPLDFRRFGYALAAEDFDGDGIDDLAMGIPKGLTDYEVDLEDRVFGGGVLVLYGSDPPGLTADGFQHWSQDTPGVKGGGEGHDYFGEALAAGDFNGNGTTDLAVGVPGESVVWGGSDRPDAGAVNVLYSNTSGLTTALNQLFHQGFDLRLASPAQDTEEAPVTHPDGAPQARSAEAPSEASLLPAYPNPFNPATTLRFALARPGTVHLSVYDALGREVARPVDGRREAGEHSAVFKAGALPSGIYVVRLEAGGQVHMQRLTLLR